MCAPVSGLRQEVKAAMMQLAIMQRARIESERRGRLLFIEESTRKNELIAAGISIVHFAGDGADSMNMCGREFADSSARLNFFER